LSWVRTQLHVGLAGELPHVVDDLGGPVHVAVDLAQHGVEDVLFDGLLPLDLAHEEKLLAVLITDRGWLSSWATPVAISPRVAILLAWISCCSASSAW
jgi:hypothetical protein